MAITLKNSDEIALMRKANLVVYEIHEELKSLMKVGVTTLEIDTVAKNLCTKYKVKPAFLNYPSSTKGVKDFPGVVCASPNDVIVHGIPDATPLRDGDILSVDFGCCYEGFYGDSARTYAIGSVTSDVQMLLDTTEQSLEEAIKMCVAGGRIGDISHAVQSTVEKKGLGVVREFVGHGIGRKMHEPPHIPNYGLKGQGRVLKSGMVLAIEPMITLGDYQVKIRSDGWTAATKDGSYSAHFEHTVAITDKGPYVLSRP